MGRLVRAHRTATGVSATVAVLLILAAIYLSSGSSAGSTSSPTGPRPIASSSVGSLTSVAMLDGARQAAQTFLHNIGVRSDVACLAVHGDKIITVGGDVAAISCATLLANAKGMLGQPALDAMTKAKVLQAVNLPSADAGDIDPHALVSLAYVPALRGVFDKLEVVLTYRDYQWWVVQVAFG